MCACEALPSGFQQSVAGGRWRVDGWSVVGRRRPTTGKRKATYGAKRSLDYTTYFTANDLTGVLLRV